VPTIRGEHVRQEHAIQLGSDDVTCAKAGDGFLTGVPPAVPPTQVKGTAHLGVPNFRPASIPMPAGASPMSIPMPRDSEPTIGSRRRRTPRGPLPLFGWVLVAIAVGVVSYFTAPPAVHGISRAVSSLGHKGSPKS